MNRLKTKPIKGFVIALFVVLIVSIGAILLFALTKQDIVVSILVYIFCGAFSALSAFMICVQLFNYLELKDDILISHVFLFRKKTKISNIDMIILKDEMYIFYVKKERFAVVSSHVQGANEIIIALDKKGIRLK